MLGELRSAESDFRQAHGCLERSGMEGSHFEAEVLDLESSLCRDQRRFGVALDLAEHALDLYRKLQDSRGTAKMFLPYVHRVAACRSSDYSTVANPCPR